MNDPRTWLLSRLVIDPSGCLLWTGRLDRHGYGQTIPGSTLVHRAMYEMFAEPIPAGLELDHLCRVRHCANVAHLEPVTHRENMRRGAFATKTHCKHGHEFTPENTYNNHGGRGCRTCGRRDAARYYLRQKAAYQ